MRDSRPALVLFAGVLAIHGVARAASIDISIGANAPEIERFAAAELERYLSVLFNIQARISTAPSDSATTLFVLGSPETNPTVRDTLGARVFPPSPAGFVGLHGTWNTRPAFVLGGGSPKGTLWAVYEQVQRWGVRFQIAGDIFPAPARFRFPDTSFVEEPALRIRQWRVLSELACGPASWGAADYGRLIDQLAKLKFNRLLIQLWQHQPFLAYEYAGITRHSSTMFFGARFPITSATLGRSLFGAAAEFQNPDLPPSHSGAQRLTDGITLVRALIEHGARRGLDSVVSATLTEFPKEFGPLIAGSQPVRQLGSLTITPGPETNIDDENLNGLAAAVLRATIDTYPGAARIALGMPEFRQWTRRYKDAWDYFDRRYAIGKITTLDALLDKAQNRRGFHGGAQRALDEVKGDLVGLYFLDRLVRTHNQVSFQFNAVAEELFPILDRILPPNSELLNFIDYTPGRVLERVSALSAVPADKIPSLLIYTLHDDNVGLLPQLSTKPLASLTRELARLKWAGASTRYWLLGDHEPFVAYFAQAAWDPQVDQQLVYGDYFQHLCGNGCAGEMTQALAALEDATTKLDRHGLGFGFPVEGMMMKHWDKPDISSGLLSAREDYRRSLSYVRKAMTRTPVRWKGRLVYFAKRLEFGIEYMNAAEFVADAGAAAARGEHSKAATSLQSGLQAIKVAIEAYAAVARDQSDRGAIAILNEYAYRPLLEKMNQLQEGR